MNDQLTYYYTHISPWSYLGHARLGAIAASHGIKVNYVPVTLGEIFPRTGGLPLAKRTLERQAYRMAELRRWPQRLDIALNLEPVYFPTDDRPAARLALTAKAQGYDIAELSLALMRACWAEDRDIAAPRTLQQVAETCGLEGAALVEEAESEEGQRLLEEACQAALADGCFGAPWYILDGEPFWGQDRLELLEEAMIR